MKKEVFTTILFLFTHQNSIEEVLLSDVTFIYIINGVHDEVMSLTNKI